MKDYGRALRWSLRVQLGLAMVAVAAAGWAEPQLWFVSAAMAAVALGIWLHAERDFRRTAPAASLRAVCKGCGRRGHSWPECPDLGKAELL